MFYLGYRVLFVIVVSIITLIERTDTTQNTLPLEDKDIEILGTTLVNILKGAEIDDISIFCDKESEDLLELVLKELEESSKLTIFSTYVIGPEKGIVLSSPTGISNSKVVDVIANSAPCNESTPITLDRNISSETQIKSNDNVTECAWSNVIHRRHKPTIVVLIRNNDLIQDVFKNMKCLIETQNVLFLVQSRWVFVSDIKTLPLQILQENAVNELTNVVVLHFELNSDGKILPVILTKEGSRFTMVSDNAMSVRTIFPNLQYKMNGIHIRVGILSIQIIHKKANSAMTLLAAISNYLNFTYTFVPAEDGTFGLKVNDTWTGIVGQLAQNDVDMACQPLLVTEQRLEVLDFVMPAIATVDLGLIYKYDSTNYVIAPWMIFWIPLSDEMYLCVFISYIIIASAICYLSASGRNRNENRCQKMDTFMFTFGCIFQRSTILSYQRSSARILFASWWIFCVMLGSIYMAGLTRALIPKGIEAFSSVDGLVELSDWKYGALGNSAHIELLKTSENTQLKVLWQAIQKLDKTDPTILSTIHDDHITKLNAGNYAFLAGLNKGRLLVMGQKDNCSVNVFKLGHSSYESLAVPKGSLLKDELERAVMTFNEAGILPLLIDAASTLKVCSEVRSDVQPLNIDDMKGSFVVIAIGLTVSCLVLIVEKLITR